MERHGACRPNAAICSEKRSREFRVCCVKNVHASFEFVSELSKANSLPEVMQIQIEFVQAQFNSFSKQLKALGDSYTKVIKEVKKDHEEAREY
jgi:hypothetical protein